MKKFKSRISEGGAIEDSYEMSMEHYSETMKKKLGSEYKRFADNVLNKAIPKESARVLEIGPGPGWAGINLLKKRNDLRLEGIEASKDMVRVATENAKKEGLSDRVKYKVGVAEEMKEIPDKYFDLVISRDSLHHWDDPEKVFLQIKRVLKDDGKVFIHDHRRDLSFFARIIVDIMGVLVVGKMAKYWKSSIAAAYTKNEINNLLNKINCKDWDVEEEFMDLIIYKS